MIDSVAREIAQLVDKGKKIDAIRLLRSNTDFGLLQAKDYVESVPAPERLYQKLYNDFCEDKARVLYRARLTLRRQQEYVNQLESELADEYKQAEQAAINLFLLEEEEVKNGSSES